MISKFDLNFKVSSPIAYAVGDQVVKRGEKAKLYIPAYMALMDKGSEPVTSKKSIKSPNMMFVNDKSITPNLSTIIESVNYIEVLNKTFDEIELKNGDKVNCYAPLKSLSNIYI